MRISEYIALFLFLLYELTEAQTKFEINVQDFQRLVSEVSRLGDLTALQNEVIQDVQTKLERQEKEIRQFKHLTRDIDELRNKVIHQEANNRDLEARLTQQQVVINELNAAISKQENTDHNPTSKKMLPEVLAVEPETVENDKKPPAIKSKNGIASKRQGIFIVPVGGIYLITTSVLAYPGREYWAEVVVNAVPIGRLNGHGADGRHGSGSQTLILYLKKGDDVAVQNYNSVDSFWGEKYSSFGGILLQEYEPGQPSVVG